MKKLFFALCALTAVSLSFYSCDNDNKNEGYYLSQGVGDIMEKEGKPMRILLDDADTVLITNSEKFDLKPGTRVSFVGEIISKTTAEKVTTYEFRAVAMDKVLTKLPILQSYLAENPELADSIGKDPINIQKAEIASKYVNINYSLYHGGIGIKHFINLIIDDKTVPVVEDGKLVLNVSLHQNAFDDTTNRYLSEGFVSFNIDEYLKMEGLKTITLNISYKWDDAASTKTITWNKEEPGAETLVRSNSINTQMFSASE